MNLPPDKARLLRQYDNEKKWELICDQVREARRAVGRRPVESSSRLAAAASLRLERDLSSTGMFSDARCFGLMLRFW